MLGQSAIRALIPHDGAMCLLDHVSDWSATRIQAGTRSHLDPANPLCRNGKLAAICGSEYALQVAALHGALLCRGKPQPVGRLAALQLDRITASRLDDPALGTLAIEAVLEWADPSGVIYRFQLADAQGRLLLEGRATIVLPPSGG